MNLSVWTGVAVAALLVSVGVVRSGGSSAIFNRHALLTVFGGTTAAMCIGFPFRQLWSAAGRLGALFLPNRVPDPEAVVAELHRLARRAQAEGGLLSLQNEPMELADGFLRRAFVVAAAAGETGETRRIMEAEIRQTRIGRQEDANVFRTMGMLAPMFGLLGTLVGMIQVLESISEPNKVGPAMALALSSAFFGIGLANFLCIPIAGQIRALAMRETLVLEMLLEGLLDVMAGKAPYLVEMHLLSYARRARKRASAAVEAERPAPEA